MQRLLTRMSPTAAHAAAAEVLQLIPMMWLGRQLAARRSTQETRRALQRFGRGQYGQRGSFLFGRQVSVWPFKTGQSASGRCAHA